MPMGTYELTFLGEKTMKPAFHCTKDDPWKIGGFTPVVHADAREVGEQQDGYPGGDIVTRKCPHCGTEWEQELPQ